MAALRKFGQYVRVDITNDKEEVIFSSDGLKIDFDIRHVSGWSRAKITITNLNPETVGMISGGGNYVTLTTALHDEPEVVLANKMYISNALEEKKLPQSEFNMFCYSKVRKAYMEKQIDVQHSGVSLRKSIKLVLQSAGYKGTYKFKHFPNEVLNYVPPSTSNKHQGSLLSVLQVMGSINRFKVYTVDDEIVFMYQVNSANFLGTSYYTSEGDIMLSTSNMRSNPKLGPASLKVYSNLDAKIIPTSVLDISNLLTIGTDTTKAALEVAENILKNSVAGYSKYQTISVQHKGSNFSKEWLTIASASSPTDGTNMNVEQWWS